MTKKSIEERLIASAKEALAIKRGEIAPARAYELPLTARNALAERAPSYTKEMIASIRNALSLSQAVFADVLNVSLGTVRSWEQGLRAPDGAAARLLQVAEQNPAALTRYVRGISEGRVAERHEFASVQNSGDRPKQNRYHFAKHAAKGAMKRGPKTGRGQDKK